MASENPRSTKKAPTEYLQMPEFFGDPKGTRTPVTGVRGQCPRPLDDGAKRADNVHIARFSVKYNSWFTRHIKQKNYPSGHPTVIISKLLRY
jgi:hypothetical protein